MQLSTEIQEQLRRYLNGSATSEVLYAWVISAQDETEFSDSERRALSTLRLLLLEGAEALRPLDDTRKWIAAMLAVPLSAS